MAWEYDDLTDLQKRAFDLCTKTDKRVIRIGGYAGTGKTTVMAAVAEALGDSCVVLSPTNKAASVLRDKDIRKAQTIHSCIYVPFEVIVYEKDEHGNNVKIKNDEGVLVDKIIDTILEFEFTAMSAEEKYGQGLPTIALVDESSMVDLKVFTDLEQAFSTIILFGDPKQLPPVGSKESALDIEPLDIEMDEVHRVAEKNPIIKYATRIRNGTVPPLRGNYPELIPAHIRDKDLYEKIVEGGFQAICYKNETRHHINRKIREVLGYKPETYVSGEPVLLFNNIKKARSVYNKKKNKWDIIYDLVAYNGQISHFHDDLKQESFENHEGIDVTLDCLPEDPDDDEARIINTFPFWHKGFWGWFKDYEKTNTRASMGKRKVCDYGYCLTGHKSQGSEFERVVVFDERPRLSRVPHDEQMKWIYTCATRAKEELMVVEFDR